MEHKDGIAPAVTVMVVMAVLTLVILDWHPLAALALALAFGGIAVNEYDLRRRRHAKAQDAKPARNSHAVHAYGEGSARAGQAPRRTLQRRRRAARMQ